MQIRMLLPVVLAAAIIGLFFFDRSLFYIVLSFAILFLIVRRKLEEKEPDEESESTPARLMQATAGLPGATFHGDVCVTTSLELPLRLAIETAPSKAGASVEVIAISAQASVPIPFCFTIRRIKSTLLFDKLVANTPIPPARFEYELKGVPLEQEDLDSTFQCASNFPQQMRRMLSEGVGGALQDLVHSHAYRLEEIAFTGTDVVIRVLPAGEVDGDAAFAQAWYFVEALTLQVQAFVVNTLHEPNATASQD